MIVAAITEGRSNGSRASGSFRRSSGSIANDSASRSGPRTNGCWMLGANSRLRADATLISPSSFRIAQRPRVRPVHEHAVREGHPAETNLVAHARSVAPAACLSAAWSSSAAGPREIGAPSSSSTGITSRTDDDVKASSAASSSRQAEVALLDRVAAVAARARCTVARVTPARMPRSSEGVKSVRSRRHQTFVVGPSSTIAVCVDEDGVVRAAPSRLRLGGHVDRVARRLDARAGATARRPARRAARSASGRVRAGRRSGRRGR